MPQDHRLVLVADIGGTNTRLALTHDTAPIETSIRKYRNAEHSGLDAVLRAYLTELDQRPDAICVAIAGPVQDGESRLTNLDWRITRDGLREATGARTAEVINDLQAQGYAIPHLPETGIKPVLAGSAPTPGGPALVVGVGTGFNAVTVVMGPQGPIVPASESGHITLPMRSTDDLELGAYIGRDHGFPAVEDALSGRGLENIYGWLAQRAGDNTRKTAADLMQARADGDDPRAVQTVDIAARLLGRVIGDLALVQLPAGGIYLIGGVARALTPYLIDAGFAEALRDKGRFGPLLARYDVSLIQDDCAALIGAASYIRQLAE